MNNRDQWTISKTSERVEAVSKIADIETVSITKLFDKLIADEIKRKSNAKTKTFARKIRRKNNA